MIAGSMRKRKKKKESQLCSGWPSHELTREWHVAMSWSLLQSSGGGGEVVASSWVSPRVKWVRGWVHEWCEWSPWVRLTSWPLLGYVRHLVGPVQHQIYQTYLTVTSKLHTTHWLEADTATHYTDTPLHRGYIVTTHLHRRKHVWLTMKDGTEG